MAKAVTIGKNLKMYLGPYVNKYKIDQRVWKYSLVWRKNKLISVLRNLLATEALPTKVLEAKTDSYSSRDILCREDGLVLYAPAPSANQKQKSRYEIVLHKPYTESLHQVYSIFRSEERDEAEIKFLCFKDKVPVFIEIAKEMANLQGLQKICDTLSEHPSWTLAHLAAHFSLYDSFNNATINSHLNSSDPSTGMSPLQVAVSTQNVKTVQLLVTAKCSLEHLDQNGNSVFHYAASTNKDVICVSMFIGILLK